MVAEQGWWQERWRRYLEEAVLLGAVPDASLRAARKAPTQVALGRGQVAAEVEAGLPGKLHTVFFRVRPLSERQWQLALAGIVADPQGAHRLLAGSPGPELEAALTAAGIQLFPQPIGKLRCTCRDAAPCRHSHALLTWAGELLEANPFLWLTVLGRERSVLQAALRIALAESDISSARRDVALTAAEPDPPALDPVRFWQTGIDLSPLAAYPADDQAPDALLRRLGLLQLPPEEKEIAVLAQQEGARGAVSPRHQLIERIPAEELLRDYTLRISRGAAALAAGQGTFRLDEHLPGKPVPAAARLSAEVETTLLREARVMSIEQLRTACPTAEAMEEQAARRALAEALSGLPKSFAVLPGRFAAERGALRAGAVLRHVYTFREAQLGYLIGDSDWVRVLEVTGSKGPYTITGLDEYKPVMGDEVWLTITDPVRPVLSATLRRRADRDLTAAAEAEQRADREAAALLLRYMKERGLEKLSDADAANFLLWEGRFRQEHCPRAVWLLHVAPGADELHSGGTKRGFRLDRVRPWRPSFGRILSARWPGFKRHLRNFSEWLERGGVSRADRERAATCVTLWCRFYTGPHEKPTKPAPLAAFLHFLWNLAPGETRRYGLSDTTMPWALDNWFTWCSGLHRKLEAAYKPHIEAAGMKGSFAHRLKTMPQSEAAHQAWLIEGYRWMGPDHYFDR